MLAHLYDVLRCFLLGHAPPTLVADHLGRPRPQCERCYLWLDTSD